jgi:toxin ParE1/3/4
MASRIIWSPKAVDQLENICEYIERDSPVYAQIFAQKVTSIIKAIPAFPQAGRVVPEYGDDMLREKIYSNYRIVYRIRPDRIEIAAICHGAQILRLAD